MRLQILVTARVFLRHAICVVSSDSRNGAALGAVGKTSAASLSPSSKTPRATLTSARAFVQIVNCSSVILDASCMRSRTPGPVSPSSENGRAAYHVPSACQTSRPIMFAKHTRSASRPLPPSRVCTSRSVGHNNNKCCPRSSLEIVPCGNSVSRAEHTAATPALRFRVAQVNDVFQHEQFLWQLLVCAFGPAPVAETRLQKNIAHLLQDTRIPREPPHGVQAFRELYHPGGADGAVRRAEPEDAAVRRWYSER